MLAFQVRRKCGRCGHNGRPALTAAASTVGMSFWFLLLASFALPILWVAAAGVLIWLLLTRQVVCDQCGQGFLTAQEIRATYEQDGKDEDAPSASDRWRQHDAGQTGAETEDHVDEERVREQPAFRVFRCPTCRQRIRITLPLPSKPGRCVSCSNWFKVRSDENGNLYIYVTEGQSRWSAVSPTLEECLSILGVDSESSPEMVKMAYKKLMQDYHPDKVARLGPELRELAARKTKEVNLAYSFLKKAGLAV